MPATGPNRPQPLPDPERPRTGAQPDQPLPLSRFADGPEGIPTGRDRGPLDREADPDRSWGLNPVAGVDLLPGEPSVRVSHAWAQTPADPPTGEAEAFTGLTPRLAAMLVVTYTRPGDLVIDTTADLAVAGTALAGSRQYHPRAATPDPTAEPEQGPSRANMVVLGWPTGPTPRAGDDAAGPLPVGPDLEATLTACRRFAASDAHLVVVCGPSAPGRYRARARELSQAVQATGWGQLRRVILVAAGPDADTADDAQGAPPDVTAAELDLVVFIVALRIGGRHD
jgi:hypothetical protein